MTNNVELYANFDTFEVFKEFKKEIRNSIVEKGLDIPLGLSLKELRSELNYVINKKITMNGPTEQSVDPTQTTNALSQSTVNIPKSEDELVKFLSNGKSDPSKYNKAKDYTTLNESNIVFGQGSRGTGTANRVTLRMEIDGEENVQTQFAKAKAFFESAMFALPDAAGNMNYFINPGIDISQYVKIKCSVFTGDGDKKTRKGFSPSGRFDRNKNSKGYADWTLKQEAVEMVRKNFINITEVMNFIKNGDIDRANQLLDKTSTKSPKLTEVKEQLGKLLPSSRQKVFQDEQGRWRVRSGTSEGGRFATLNEILGNIPTSTQAYMNAVQLVNNLKIIKKIEEDTVSYTLYSNFEDFPDTDVDFFMYIQKAIRAWGIDREDYWFSSLVKRVEKLISKYESKE